MSGTMEILIREMTIEDYEAVYHLWTEIRGFGIRSIDDSKEGVERFLKRNPTTSVVAVQNGRIVGNILCGHDGRTGCFYHVCVDPDYRKHGIGYRMVRAAIHALQKESARSASLPLRAMRLEMPSGRALAGRNGKISTAMNLY